MASATGYDAAIQELLPWKANVNARDKENKTPLYKVSKKLLKNILTKV